MKAKRLFEALGTQRLMVLVLLLCIFFMATREIIDPDFWWHLRTGQYISETTSIPRQDIFSHTMPDQPWITHEWLTEVVLYGTYTVAGQNGLILAFATIITAAFALLYLRCPGRPYLAAFIVLLAAITSAVTWGVRPQMLSLLLASASLYILDSYQAGRRRCIWLMPPLMVLWANVHGSFLLGLVLPIVYVVGATITNLASERHQPKLDWRDIRLLLVVTLISAAATVVNPNGVRLLLYPLGTLGSTAMQAYITEWFSPDFHLTQFQPLAAFILMMIVALGLSRRRPTATEFLFLVGFGYAALRSARHIPYFVLVAAPILTAQLLDIWDRSQWSRTFTESRRQAGNIHLAANWLLLTLVLLGGVIRVSLVLQGNADAQREVFPVDAVEFIVDEQVGGNIYNLYHWGGYLVWTLYPDYPVFIDGRADVYGDAFIDEYLQAYQLREDWHAPLDKYGVNLVIIDKGSSLSTVLNESPNWDRPYVDERAAIFVRQGEGK